jgi:protein-disulfide isomerase
LTDALEGSRLVSAALLLALVVPGGGAAALQDDLREARTMGSPTAPVTMYAMSDFQCPWCGRFARETMPQLEHEYVQTGKVKFVFVNLPLPMHPNAEPAAELAMCAARQGKFWPIHNLLFRHQDGWARLREPGSYFLSLGDSAGANREELAQCLRQGLTRELVQRDADGSVRSGAHSTPTFYVEGGLIVGAQPIAVFRQVLDSIYTIKTRNRGQ